jgi:Skp family chaperone for outer membrane proteins
VLLLAPSAATAQKIAVIDFQLVFDQYEATEDAQRTLDRQLKEWDEEAKAMRDSIDALKAEIESQRLMLSEERLQEKQDEMRRRQDEYQSFAESIWGVNGRAVKRNEELTQPIAERILKVVTRIGDERNLDLILDAGTGGVVWAKDEVNITQFVLDDLALTVQEQKGGGSGDAAE